MTRYVYLANLFAGAFLTNAVPHFVSGISGDPFPTPFANPPGKGLSSPTVNVLWALLNLLIGAGLFHLGNVMESGITGKALFFLGIAATSIPSSIRFSQKHPR